MANGEFELVIEFLEEFDARGSIVGQTEDQRARLIEICKEIALQYWFDEEKYVRVVSYHDY
jgi:hypothetical protein